MTMTSAVTICACLTAATVVLTPAPAAAQLESHVSGCYDMHVGDWSPHAPDGDSIYFMPPARVRFGIDSGRAFDDRPRDYAVETVAGAMPSVHPFSFWRVLGPDSIAVTWMTSFAGVTMRLAVMDTMIGTASTFTDVVFATLSAQVRAVRVDCDAPLPEASRVAYRYSPVVRLAAADSLVLEHAPPPGLLQPTSRDRVYMARRVAAEPYHGAQAIEVWTRSDGSVISISMHYPDHIGFDDLLQRLIAEYGDPTSGPHRTPRESAIWSDRMMYMSLARQLNRGTGMMISIRSQRAQRPSPAEHFVGCYEVQLESNGDEPLHSALENVLPPRIELSLEPDTTNTRRSGRSVFRAGQAPGAMPSIYPFSWWHITEADSVVITWTNLLHGINVRAALGDTLRGSVKTHTDVVGGRTYSTGVIGVPVRCDAPLPESSRASYVYSPVVRLEEGDSIVLDRPLATGLKIRRVTTRSYYVEGSALPPYIGSPEIEVWTHEDGSVRAIRMHYPDAAGYDALLARLVAVYGEPASRGRLQDPPRAVWSSPMMYIAVSERLTSNSGLMISVFSRRRR